MVTGSGSTDRLLSDQQVFDLCASAFEEEVYAKGRVLILIPDHTRTAPIDLMFRTVYGLLADRFETLDFMVALGTHPPMSEEAICRRVGITTDDWRSRYSKARFFNHAWNDPKSLKNAGTITGKEAAAMTGGLMRERVEVTVNRQALEYDTLLIIGPVFPHEVAGFSGGNKYLIPGIAGPQIIDMFHWLAALITNPRTIGRKDTPVRAVIDRAASFLDGARRCLSLVVKEGGLAGLYHGTPEDSWRAAADLSAQIHIEYKDRPFRKVLSRAPRMYDDLWTGGKCMYKLEPVVADGGELIIYAPHITEVSAVHGAVIERIGYHVRDYFVRQMERFRDVPGGIMAHATHVKGIGRFEGGVEEPRVNVRLATKIPEPLCRKIHLGYCDPDSIDLAAWEGREPEGILVVPKAGETLYRLKNDPF